ncbi:transposase [Patescibacteria group bacterium]|nr:transposase [Patescibacteria group bacterium]
MAKRLYKNKYRIKTTRLQGWDYADPGLYFITICTYKKIHYFGHVKNKKMILNNAGCIAHEFWLNISKYNKNTSLHEFIVMPNHIHGILEVISNQSKGNLDNKQCCNRRDVAMLRLYGKQKFLSHISPKHSSISTIIRSYKSACTKQIRQINPDFSWQSRFYEHIIDDDFAYDQIRFYIKTNPKYWHVDRNNI